MFTSIIILTYNKLDYTKKCLNSIRKYTTNDTYEIIVVDNNSTDGTVDWLKQQNDIRTIFNEKNLGFPKGCNQGISISKGDNILLLNNDTVVTHNWLNNLIKALYSSQDIGAVGPVSNYCSNLQAINVPYTNLAQMHEFAKSYNISNPSLWEERLRLIGFCFLFKRKVLKEVGLLDEVFTPGNLEDDDYSLRIRKAGYKLLLCKDTFIHHYGSISFNSEPAKFKNVMSKNIKKFIDKWGINPEYFMRLRKDFTEKIKSLQLTSPNILHLECGAGGTLLDIKNEIPKANLYGLESNDKAIVNTDSFAEIDIKSNNNIDKYPKNFFDIIIITTPNHDLDYYLKVFKNTKKHLKESGSYLLALPKDSEIKESLLNNELPKIFADFMANENKTYIDIVLHLEINKVKKKQKNEKKICFISCVNDEKTYQKSKQFINNLTIPESYKIEFICKKNSNCITKSYNEAMKETNAKYKVYLHQDVYIINNNFIKNIIDLFKSNNKIGMIGVVGSKYVPKNGVWWDEQCKYGKVYENHSGKLSLLNFSEVKDDYTNVSLIDGLIMITQYDIPWRDDLFDDWHFYDASQSKEFKNAGLKVVIPKQVSPWCIHDCEIVSTTNYEKYRKIFINEYLNNIYKTCANSTNSKNKPTFVTLLPGIQNIHLIKDVGMIPYILNKYYDYQAKLVAYAGREFPYLENEVKGLQIQYIKNTGNSTLDGYYYLLHNARNIDILQVYHFLPRTFYWIKTYKSFNPKGKIYLKLDANSTIKNFDYYKDCDATTKNLLSQCDLISVETKELYDYLNQNWPIEVAYVPNGFHSFNYKDNSYVKYEQKENIICSVGNLGSYAKATEVLMEAFKLAYNQIGDWKLKLIGPIDQSFKQYLKNFYKENPQLRNKIIFTGELSDRTALYAEYKKAKIFCLPSRWESFGISLVEAISHGCYIICSDIISANDITNNEKYGDIFQKNDINKLSKLIITNCNNESKLKKLCNHIQDYAYQRFNWIKICKEIDCLLKK